MKIREVFIGDRIYLEIQPDELEGGFDAETGAEEEAPKGTVTVVDLVPDVYSR